MRRFCLLPRLFTTLLLAQDTISVDPPASGFSTMPLAPKEIYDGYTESLENLFRSVRFQMQHADPKVLEGVN
jgi:hypothetical protein